MSQILLPDGYTLYHITLHHPGRTGGSTSFHILSQEEPTPDSLIPYVEQAMGEEVDLAIDHFDINQVFTEYIALLDDFQSDEDEDEDDGELAFLRIRR